MSFLLGLGAATGLGSVLGVDPITNALNYSANRAFPNTVIPNQDVIDLYRRGYITKFVFYELMKFYGYNTRQADMLYLGSDSIITPEQSLTYRVDQSLRIEYLKENYIESEGKTGINQATYETAKTANLNRYYNNMKSVGYRKLEADKHFNANRPLPTFSTILEWLAKEVFEPEAIKLFRLDEEEPEALRVYMDKYGVPSNESSKYWVSHWNTIGYGQWRTLYNRFNDRRDKAHILEQVSEYGLKAEDVIITDEAYKKYFTVLEQTPYFRDRLLGATSEPLNFTTLQDLYRYGIINTGKLKEFLRDYNWSSVNADYIVDAWKRKFPYGDRLPKYDNILYQFGKGIFTRLETELKLKAEGVDDETIKFQCDKISDDIDERRINNHIKGLAINYGKLKLSQADLILEIAKITTDVSRRAYILLEIDSIAEKYRTRPSLRQIGRAYTDGKITLVEFTAYLNSRYYNAADTAIILKVYKPDPPPK